MVIIVAAPSAARLSTAAQTEVQEKSSFIVAHQATNTHSHSSRCFTSAVEGNTPVVTSLIRLQLKETTVQQQQVVFPEFSFLLTQGENNSLWVVLCGLLVF